MIACCQINRDNQKDDDKTPQVHELKGTGKLEECADYVMMLHWPYRYANPEQQAQIIEKKKQNQYYVIVGKHRYGAFGYEEIEYHPQYFQFRDKIKEQPIIKKTRDIVEPIQYEIEEEKIIEPESTNWGEE